MLSPQIDELEAEIETLEASKSKKDKDTVSTLEGVIRNHRFHIDKLEAVRVINTRTYTLAEAEHQPALLGLACISLSSGARLLAFIFAAAHPAAG